MSASTVSFSAGTPETVLPPVEDDVRAALDEAARQPLEVRRDAYARVAARTPRCLEAWAGLAEAVSDPVERYAYARVGYHRGLDGLRAAGWRGSGFVRWRHQSNRGFLRCLDALRRAAEAIGEADEAERCAVFLRQLDPEWPPPELPS
jgi:hypothetical protein